MQPDLVLSPDAFKQIMAQAAWSRGLDPDRLSFTHAVRVIKRKMSQTAAVPPERLKAWRHALIEEISQGRSRSLRQQQRSIQPARRKAKDEQLQRPPSRRPASPAASTETCVAYLNSIGANSVFRISSTHLQNGSKRLAGRCPCTQSEPHVSLWGHTNTYDTYYRPKSSIRYCCCTNPSPLF